MIALRYDLTKYPTLLLFAEQGTIDGEEYARSKKPKSISDYLIALATRPEVLEGKKQRHQLEKAALETTVQLKRDGIDRFFDAFWKENNCKKVYAPKCTPVSLATVPAVALLTLCTGARNRVVTELVTEKLLCHCCCCRRCCCCLSHRHRIVVSADVLSFEVLRRMQGTFEGICGRQQNA